MYLQFKSLLISTLSLYKTSSKKFLLSPRSHHLFKIVRIASREFMGISLTFILIVKSGYPPRSLTIVPELPLASLGLKSGEQIIVSQKPDTSRGLAPQTSTHASSFNPHPSPSVPIPFTASRVQPTVPAPPRALSPLAPAFAPSASGPEHVETDGGFLIHRVRILFLSLRTSCWVLFLSSLYARIDYSAF